MDKVKTETKWQDPDVEAAVLGSILLKPEAIAEIEDILKASDFTGVNQAQIYKTALEVYREGLDVDILTISSHLKKKKIFKDVGGHEYLAKLINFVPTAAHIKSYAEIIITKARRRGLQKAASSILELSKDEQKDINQIVEKAEVELFNVSQQHIKSNIIPLEEILGENLKTLKYLQENRDQLRGLSSGFNDLDNFLAGFQKTDLTIIAGRPGMGKTGFALNLAYNIAYQKIAKKQKVVLYFSLEMSQDQLVDRIISMHTGVDNWKLRTGRLNQKDFKKITDSEKELGQASLFIDDSPGLNISEIRTKTRRLNYTHPVDLVIVDYLQLMSGLETERGANRVLEISTISRGLKLLAKELNIPIIALSQLSRQTEERENKKPALVDLRDSGSIEQDADIVAFLYREEYYHPDLPDKKGLLEVQIQKHRNGALGKVELYFNKEIQRYLSLDKSSAGELPPDD